MCCGLFKIGNEHEYHSCNDCDAKWNIKCEREDCYNHKTCEFKLNNTR